MDVKTYQSYDVIHHPVKRALVTMLRCRVDLSGFNFRQDSSVVDLVSRGPDQLLIRWFKLIYICLYIEQMEKMAILHPYKQLTVPETQAIWQKPIRQV
jgi:hypothetical protein